MPRKPKTPFVNRLLSKRDKIESGVVEDLLLEVAEERDFLEVIFDSMLEAVIATDPHGNVLLYNSAAQTLFGFHGDKVIGENILGLLPDGNFAEIIRNALESGERVYDAEVRVDQPVERVLRVNMISLALPEKGFIGTVILAIDITERKAAEARLSQAEKLAARTTISAGIAHEIRNPLNSLGIHLQLAEKQMGILEQQWQEKVSGEPPESLGLIGSNLQVIRDEMGRLDMVVQNFLMAVRPQRPNWSVVPLESLVTSALNLLEPEFSENNIQIIFEPLDKEVQVPVDEIQIRQALINILQNSVHAMSGGGEIRVRLRLLQDRARIQIIDSGGGIPEEVQKRIFEPYFTTRADGTGLGLAVVERIVREHRGRIHIYSEQGEGTCVTIDLPLSAEHERQIPILEDEEDKLPG